MNYFKHPYLSNSALTKLGQELGLLRSFEMSEEAQFEAFRLGTLFDLMETEPHLIDRLNNVIIGTDYSFTDDELRFYEAKQKLIYKNPLYSQILSLNPDFQKEVYIDEFTLDGIFKIGFKAKLDLFLKNLVVDLKTTKCKTQKEFENSCHTFGYFRQMYLYMKSTGANKSILFGISKTTNKVFQVIFNENHSLYKENEDMCKLLIQKAVFLD